MVKVHSVIKFWARKTPSIIEKLIPVGVKSLLDPFCGSGTSGYVGVLKGIRRIMLSDINPVAVFITHTLLNRSILEDEIYTKFKKLCRSIEKDVYAFTYNGKKYTIEKAAWVTYYVCPYCGEIVDPRKSRKYKSGTLVCQRCNRKFLPIKASQFFEKVFEIHAYDENRSKVVLKDPKLLRAYEEECRKYRISTWFPDGEFAYSNGKSFIQHPHRIKKVSELFTERGLFAASTLYQYIEDTWLEDPKQGDLLKLAFISSIIAATKMLPYTTSSGTSWKLPRYWIPHIRFEKNFCNTFIRKLNILYEFKRSWANYVKNYSVRAIYDFNYFSNLEEDHSINIIRADARKLDIDLKFDLIIMDPPHYAEINYYELTYMWQLWLKGKFNDERFKDLNYWKYEIDVNPRLGRSLPYYIEEIARVTYKYMNMLTDKGKLILILHNSNPEILNATIKRIKEYVGFVQYQEIPVKIPSSAQGIHGRRKHKLYLLLFRNT